MKESLLKLAKLLAEDEKFLQEFSSKKSVDEKYDFAQKSVQGYTKDDFVKFLDELEKSYESNKGVLSEDLEKVSGGANAKTKAAAMAMLALTAAGGISNLASAPLGTSAMLGGSTTASVAPSLDFDKLFANEIGQDLFDYENSSKSGELRSQIFEELKKDEEGFAGKIKNYYTGSNKYLKWLRSVGYTWTGWKFEYSDKQKIEVQNMIENGEYPAGKIMLWLVEKFKEGYWLYYNKDLKLTLCKSSFLPANIINYDWFKRDNPDTELDEAEFNEVVQDVEHKLNQARAFRGACAKAGEMDVAETVMKTV